VGNYVARFYSFAVVSVRELQNKLYLEAKANVAAVEETITALGESTTHSHFHITATHSLTTTHSLLFTPKLSHYYNYS
jgi:hypothetical protein